MRLPYLSNSRGALYPLSLLFFLTALIIITHYFSLYTIHYRALDSLENLHSRATIQLLMEIEQNKNSE